MKGEPDACDLKNAARHLALKNKVHFLILNVSSWKPALPDQAASCDLAYFSVYMWGWRGDGRAALERPGEILGSSQTAGTPGDLSTQELRAPALGPKWGQNLPWFFEKKGGIG